MPTKGHSLFYLIVFQLITNRIFRSLKTGDKKICKKKWEKRLQVKKLI